MKIDVLDSPARASSLFHLCENETTRHRDHRPQNSLYYFPVYQYMFCNVNRMSMTACTSSFVCRWVLSADLDCGDNGERATGDRGDATDGGPLARARGHPREAPLRASPISREHDLAPHTRGRTRRGSEGRLGRPKKALGGSAPAKYPGTLP